MDLSPVAAGQHGAFNVEVSGAGGVAAEQPRLMAVVDKEPVAVAKTKVAIEVGDSSSTVARSFVINGDPVAVLELSPTSMATLVLATATGSLSTTAMRRGCSAATPPVPDTSTLNAPCCPAATGLRS